MEHPFAQYIQFLGKGKQGSRDLTQGEAEQALTMILSGQAEPVQLGAFLMLMRVKEEAPAEVAGFVKAARASLSLPANLPAVDLDWASYAGKRRQLPWYLLSALLLSSHGAAVLMHGIGGIAGRVCVPQALEALGLKPASSLQEAAQQIAQKRFSFLPLAVLNQEMLRLLNLKELLGLRSPIHTVIRMLNPLAAPTSIMGIFHPGYDEKHQLAALLLQDKQLAVFKGEGGEAERNPDAPCKIRLVQNGQAINEEWPALFSSRHLRDETMDISRLAKLWRGEIDDEYGKAAVTGTAAIALRAMGRAASVAEAEAMAAQLWATRNIAYISIS